MGRCHISRRYLVEDHRALSSPMSALVCSQLTGWDIGNLIRFTEDSTWKAS